LPLSRQIFCIAASTAQFKISKDAKYARDISVDREMKQAASSKRDLRIDFLRGFFILSLCGSHLTWLADTAGFQSPIRFYDMQPFGFSSPAEFFVFFSGYVLTLVLGRDYNRTGFWLLQMRALDRSASLYILNVFTFAIVVGCSTFLFTSSPSLLTITHISEMKADPINFIFDFLTFRNNLTFFEILRNYIFFIPLVASAVALSRVNKWLPISISICVWLLFQFHLIPGPQYGSFNPYAWQLIFFMGVTAAMVRPLTTWTFPNRTRQIVVCLLLLLLLCIARQWFFHGIPSEHVPWASKPGIGPLRVVHFCLAMWTAMLLLPASDTLARSRIVRAVVQVGQNSLECFCLSNFLIYMGAHYISLDPQSSFRYWIALSAAILIMLACAHMFGWFKSRPWTKSKADSGKEAETNPVAVPQPLSNVIPSSA